MALDLPVELSKEGVKYVRTASTPTDYWNLRAAGWVASDEVKAEPVKVEVAEPDAPKDQKPVKVRVGIKAGESQAGDSTPAEPAGDANA